MGCTKIGVPFTSVMIHFGWEVGEEEGHGGGTDDAHVVNQPGNCLLVGLLLACLLTERPSNMRVYLRDGPAQTSLRAATLR